MSVICLAGTKGSPGTTTLALGLAVEMGARKSVVLVEADPDGGDLAVRFEAPEEPGLASFEARGRHGATDLALDDDVRKLGELSRVMMAPTASWRACSAVEGAAVALRGALERLTQSVVIVDCGRLSTDSPSLPLLRAADTVLLVSRTVADQVLHLQDVCSRMQLKSESTQLVLVGGHHSVARPTARELDIKLAASIPEEPKAARMLYGAFATRRYRRTRFRNAVAALADRLVDTGENVKVSPKNGLTSVGGVVNGRQ